MTYKDADHLLVPPLRATVDRRQLLKQLGMVAGLAVAAPVIGRLGSFRRSLQRLELARPALGTWVRVVVQHEDPAIANRAAESAFQAIARVDAQMSIHRADSQLVAVNAAAGENAVRVDHAVFEVVTLACDGARRTADVYDPTVLPLMRLYGFYDSGRNRFPSDRQIADTLDHMGHRHVLLDAGAESIGLNQSGVGLDLGSIGKGWALDRAVDAIRAEGVLSALVDVGGNCYALGVPEPNARGWSVGIVHPVTGKIDRMLMLNDMAVGTSGNSEQYHMLGQVRVGHLFDARRGRPSDGHLSSSVLARTGVESDMLSTISFLLGPDRFRGFPGAVESYFIG